LLFSSGLLALLDVLTTFLRPFLLGALLEQRRFIFAGGLFAAGIVGGLARAHSRYHLRIIGMHLRSALTSQICDRNLEFSSPAEQEQADAPDSIVLMEVDLPQFIISFFALSYILGWQSVLAGCAIMVIGIPMFSKLMSLIFQRMSRVMVAKDARVWMVNEVLGQARQIKLHGWQPFFRAKIDGARAHEI
ncbi:hypothetical protein CDV36_015310, partial [Fusarium kuroshium]